MSSLVRVTTGREAARTGTARVIVFLRNDANKEVPVSIVASGGNPAIQTITRGQKLLAYPAISEECGAWFVDTYRVENDTILKVAVQRSVWPHLNMAASQYIRIRDSGPYQKITVALVGAEGCALHEAVIEGRFDCVGIDECAEVGIDIPKHFEKFHLGSMVNKVMKIEVIEPELTARTMMKTTRVRTRGRHGAEKLVVVKTHRRVRHISGSD